MKEIGKRLGKKDWDFNVDPCTGQRNWTSSIQNAVTCNCLFANATICHVVSIVLKSQNLSGTLPSELVRLPYLQEIDLTRNYLNGTIPSQWGSVNLVNISILGNRVTGPIPKELGNITTLKSLVVEFNQLSGELPLELGNLPQLERFRLGDNQFSGTLPDFIQKWKSLERLVLRSCNLIGMVPEYLGDLIGLRSLNTGHFFDSGRVDYYTWSNTTKLDMNNGELYMDARVSALSLTYYAFCMGNGSYTISLHFAEIMFTDDQTYSSLGRRIFDIYVQRKLVLKDFNIAKEAGGVGKAIIKNFTASVNSSTLEIRLQWAGKGTTAIPFGSVHGPLISAISVHPDFTPQEEDKDGVPKHYVVGIVVTGALVIIIIFGIAWWRGCLRRKVSLEKAYKTIGDLEVHILREEGDLMDLVDERLGNDFKREEVVVMINVALLCTQVSPMHRPTMASVVCMLEGKTDVKEVVLDTSEVLDGKKLEMQQYYNMREKNKTLATPEESISMGETSAFMSDTDLYSINMDSSS
ncbi:leucine-rich repeat receptor-like serine/threonine-protein [Vigna angularis]|uniref:non-specific serine/threonine protein kinase n=1 Tax=Phaseolus angularis TaxID=3914 RepID=A0A8T0JJP5_PHAAN|nr:leucine-rich repeat receptor-like serine/threonine-protein [Vigna angularis]